MPAKKQSIQKREIIQNGIISIPFGLMCGGIPGAIALSGITALMASIEEKKDQELRETEYNRRNPSAEQLRIEQKHREERLEESQNITKQIIELMQHDMKLYGTISAPYWDKIYTVNVNRPKNVEMKINYAGVVGEVTATGILYNKKDYLKKLLSDYNNPNLLLVNLSSMTIVNIKYSSKLFHGYTIDNGKTFIICA